MVVRSRTPLRISFCGGGTDIPPFCDIMGGVVLNATINKYAYVSLIPRVDKKIKIISLDYKKTLEINSKDDFQYNGQLDLVKAVLKQYSLEIGFDVFIHCDSRPGSGLASSSALTVGLISALQLYIGKLLSKYEVAELAYFIERKCLGSPGGKQDQFAVSFGGFNFIEFFSDTTVVNTLRLSEETLNELNYRLILCNTGQVRKKPLGKNQIKQPSKKKYEINDYLLKLKELTVEMKKVLLKNQLDSFGYLLHEAWLMKKKTHSQMKNPLIEKMYYGAKKLGALGGKMLGAGGGGYLLLYCRFDRKHIIENYLNQLGGKIIPFTFDNQGVQSWMVKE